MVALAAFDGFDALAGLVAFDALAALGGKSGELYAWPDGRAGREWAAMTDADTPLQVLKDRVLAFAAERDWQQFHSPKNLAMALAAEAAELTEHFLWTEPGASHARAADPARRAQIAEELADVLIYALEFANVTGLDLTAAALAKLKRNAEKYPVEKARGRSDKYTEL